MKSVCMFILVAGFTACGPSNEGSSSVKNLAHRDLTHVRPASEAPDWESVKKVRFFHDDQPVDGNFGEIILTRNISGTYDVVSHVVSSTRGRPTREYTSEIANGLTCENGFADEIGTLTNVICLRDKRSVDGPLTTILFEINSSGRYNSRKVFTTSGQSGPATSKVTELATDLILEVL